MQMDATRLNIPPFPRGPRCGYTVIIAYREIGGFTWRKRSCSGDVPAVKLSAKELNV